MRYLNGNYFSWQAKKRGRRLDGQSNPFLTEMLELKESAPNWVRLASLRFMDRFNRPELPSIAQPIHWLSAILRIILITRKKLNVRTLLISGQVLREQRWRAGRLLGWVGHHVDSYTTEVLLVNRNTLSVWRSWCDLPQFLHSCSTNLCLLKEPVYFKVWGQRNSCFLLTSCSSWIHFNQGLETFAYNHNAFNLNL